MKKKPTHKRIGRLEREILVELTAGDLLYGFTFSMRSARRMYKLARERAAYRYRLNRATQRLLEQKFILEQSGRLTITDKGRSVLGTAVTETRMLLGTKWDGKWRIVVFDIPEKYGVLRKLVRDVLKRAGFALLQRSVWIFPYECDELVQLIQRESKLSSHILYGVLERIEGDRNLRKHFRL